MNTEIINNVEEVAEVATEVFEEVTKTDGGFWKGFASGAGVTIAVLGGVKLVITGIKKRKSKTYIEAEVVELKNDEEDEVEVSEKMNF